MASAYRRRCKHCNRWISLRQMPAGQWVAFENEAAHVCAKPNRRSAPTTKKPVDYGIPQKDAGFENFEMPKSIDAGSSTGNNGKLAPSGDHGLYSESKAPSSSGMPKKSGFNWSWLYLLVAVGIILKLFAAVGRSSH
jgi:hypothetical protein